MELTPADLTEKNATLLDELHHSELIPFVKKYLNEKTNSSRLFNGFNILFLLLVGALFGVTLSNEKYVLATAIFHVSIGIGMAFLLLPIHEIIHALAYKWAGAKNTSFDMNLKKFYFMALADKFVADSREFYVVAIAPFAVITCTLFLVFSFVPFYWKITTIGTIIMHSLMSSGDFGLLSYLDFHKDKNVVTYDDIENKVSYFYSLD